eukprot:4408367-Pyramimonas_sp.AAC.1
MLTRAYQDHALTKECLQETGRWPVPLGLYADCVRFTPIHAGRTDSILNVSVINLLSQNKHYLGFLRSNDKCGRGCGGLCTTQSLMEVISWQLGSLVRGRVPTERHDGSAWRDGDEPRSGDDLGFRGVLLYVMGDWAKFQKTFGMASWAS